MAFNYYETITSKIKGGMLAKVTHENTKNNREIWCCVHMLDGKSYNIYNDGKAKISRVESVLNALDNFKGGENL